MNGQGNLKMSEATKAHSIISYYQTQYKSMYGKSAIVNRNKAQYSVINILKDLSVSQIKQLIDFYLKTDKYPNFISFCYEYDEVLIKMNEELDDLEIRRHLLDNTKKTVDEFRKRYNVNK
jgi:hypothetical protein